MLEKFGGGTVTTRKMLQCPKCGEVHIHKRFETTQTSSQDENWGWVLLYTRGEYDTRYLCQNRDCRHEWVKYP